MNASLIRYSSDVGEDVDFQYIADLVCKLSSQLILYGLNTVASFDGRLKTRLSDMSICEYTL